MTVAPEPPHAHGTAAKTAIVLCNLGTPDAPTPAAVRRYLAEFLSDPRIVEIPRLAWLPILHGIVLRTRPAQSAQKYAQVWMPEGSPLVPPGSAAIAFSTTRRLPDPAGTLPSRNSSATITSCSAHSASTGW